MPLTEDHKKKYWKYVNEENNLKELESFVKEIEEDPEEIDELIHLKNEYDKTALDILCELSNSDDSSSIFDKISFLLSLSKDFYTSSKEPPLSFLGDNDTAKRVECLFFFHQWCLKVCENQNIPNFNRTLFLVWKSLEYMSKIEYDKNNSGIFIFGDTRIGKSTFINYLLGTNYNIFCEDDQYYAENISEENATVGHSLISETSYPGVYTLNCSSGSYLLIDMPGFKDNRQLNNSQKTLSPYEIASGVSTSVIEKKLGSVFLCCLTIEFSSFLSSNFSDIAEPIKCFILTTIKIEDIEKFDSEILPNIFLIVTKIPPQRKKNKDCIVKRLHDVLNSSRKITFEDTIYKSFFTKILQDWANKAEEKVFLADISNDECREKIKEISGVKLVDIKKFNLERNLILEEFRKLVNVVDDFSNKICRECDQYNVEKKELISIFNHDLENQITTLGGESSDSFQEIYETICKFKSNLEKIEKKIKILDMLKDADNQFLKKLQDIRDFDPSIFPRKIDDGQGEHGLTEYLLPDFFYQEREGAKEKKENSINFFSSNKTKGGEPASAVAISSSLPFEAQITKGGGDCAFHAALGNLNEESNMYEVGDIEVKRQEMADAIKNYRSHPKSNNLMHLIKEAILELAIEPGDIILERNIIQLGKDNLRFKNNDNARLIAEWNLFEAELNKHEGIIDAINNFTQDYINKNPNAKLTQASSLKDKFDNYRNDDRIFSDLKTIILSSNSELLKTAYNTYVTNKQQTFDFELTNDLLNEYASYISQKGKWLLPCELGIIAYVFGITILFYMDGQRADFAEFNPDQLEKVYVFFNGIDHYQRMIGVQNTLQCGTALF